MAYQGSFKLNGATSAAGGAISASNFGRAHFVRVQTQVATNTVPVTSAVAVILTKFALPIVLPLGLETTSPLTINVCAIYFSPNFSITSLSK